MAQVHYNNGPTRLLMLLGALIASLGESAPVAAADVDFAKHVAPIIEQHCIRCHKPGNEKGDVSLATLADLSSAEYVSAGSPDESYLIELVTPPAASERPAMPKEGDPLSAEQVAVLRTWIEQGAHWPDEVVLRERSRADASWWSLQPLSDAAPPDVPQAPEGWKPQAIDRFVAARLAEKDLEPSPPADSRTLVRRATYDLIGLPPTPEQVATFLQACAAETGAAELVGEVAYEQLIDRLLASQHYGEHWGRHWLDVVRFGESNGFEQNFLIDNLWPFRDYVIESLNEDKPFNQLVLEHLAGDSIGPGDPNVEVGLTFLVCGPYDSVGNQDAVQAAQIRANTIDEIIRATSESFLGLTVGCARCHDHKFDPILQRDYYSLYATFAGVSHADRVVATPEQIQQRESQLKPLRSRKADLSKQIADIENAAVARGEESIAEYEARWTRPPIARTGTEERFAPQSVRFVRLLVSGVDTNPNAASGYHIDEFQVYSAEETPRNVALSSHGGLAEGASRVAEDFADAYGADLTIDNRFGARWIAQGRELKITLAAPTVVDRVVFSSDGSGAAGDHPTASFACEYTIEVSSDGETWTQVADSANRQPDSAAHRRKRLLAGELTEADRKTLAELRQQRAAVDREIAAVPSLPTLRVGRLSEKKRPFHVFIGGDPQRPGDEVVPASLSSLPKAEYALSYESPEKHRRLSLARWMVSPDNPLTPRVLANRLWHYHFGAGIVDTPSDFGYMGGRPTHPALLDWLARQVHAAGWRLKPLHKTIMMSQAYRQASTFRATAAGIDGDSRLLWRFPPRRLSAEEIRDTVLSLAGKLDRRSGGPGFRLYRYMRDNVSTYAPLDHHGPDTYRRAVYHQNARAARIDLMTDFDSPDCAFAAPRRASTTTPLQALTMMNHSFTMDMAAALAKRIEQDAGNNDRAGQIERAFELVFSRSPSREEQQAAAALIESHNLRALCRGLLNSNELIYVN